MYYQKTNILRLKCGQKYKENLPRLSAGAMKISGGDWNFKVVVKKLKR